MHSSFFVHTQGFRCVSMGKWAIVIIYEKNYTLNTVDITDFNIYTIAIKLSIFLYDHDFRSNEK